MHKRDNYKTHKYIEHVGYVCMNPKCKSGVNLQVHHIIPFSKCGLDEEQNFIVLCADCQHKMKVHSNFEEIKNALFILKEFNEWELLKD